MKLIENLMLSVIIGGAIILIIDELSKAQMTDEKDIEAVDIDAEEVENEDKILLK